MQNGSVLGPGGSDADAVSKMKSAAKKAKEKEDATYPTGFAREPKAEINYDDGIRMKSDRICRTDSDLETDEEASDWGSDKDERFLQRIDKID